VRALAVVVLPPHDLDLSWHKTRPIHPRRIPKPRCASKKYPLLIAEVAHDHPEAERLEIWFLDEARSAPHRRTRR
jgi:hypothetical protein